MTTGDWFNVANSVLCLGAAISYGWNRQWNNSLYWVGAVILNVAVLWRSLS